MSVLEKSKTQEVLTMVARKHLNPQLANLQFAAGYDAIKTKEIKTSGLEISDNLAIQKKILQLKALIPSDVPPSSSPALSEEALKIIDDLSSKGISLNKKDIKDLKHQADVKLDELKLKVQELFRGVEALNADRIQILNLARVSLHNDPTSTMVRNQRT